MSHSRTCHNFPTLGFEGCTYREVRIRAVSLSSSLQSLRHQNLIIRTHVSGLCVQVSFFVFFFGRGRVTNFCRLGAWLVGGCGLSRVRPFSLEILYLHVGGVLKVRAWGRDDYSIEGCSEAEVCGLTRNGYI